jgi:hypothetical protein
VRAEEAAEKLWIRVGAGFSPHINQIESMRLQPLRDHFPVRVSFVIHLRPARDVGLF